MEFLTDLEFDNVAGVALVLVGVWAAVKAVKTVMKVAMIAVALIGLYLFLTA